MLVFVFPCKGMVFLGSVLPYERTDQAKLFFKEKKTVGPSVHKRKLIVSCNKRIKPQYTSNYKRCENLSPTFIVRFINNVKL